MLTGMASYADRHQSAPSIAPADPSPQTNAAALVAPTLPVGTPEVRAVAISSLDGSAALDGRSGGLGNAHDQALLQAVRDWSDAIVVTHETAWKEGYGTPTATCPKVRIASGQQAHPQLVIVSRSLSLDAAVLALAPLVILTPSREDAHPAATNPGSGDAHQQREAQRRARAAELRAKGHTVVEIEGHLGSVPAAVQRLGFARVVVEGGPTLYSALAASRGVQIWHLSLSPTLTTDGTTPLFPCLPASAGSGRAQHLRLEALRVAPDGLLMTRYAAAGHQEDDNASSSA